jgi:hypothetical protein
VHVSHLRDKVEPDPNKPRFVLTVRGVGYSPLRRTSPRAARTSHYCLSWHCGDGPRSLWLPGCRPRFTRI